ncbi:hypothetical protein [Phaeodactylibacter sp.]|uniref:hypothetical protein n=1 Tax=Phaeodactylibacter sp. TaxID=1940289 RepID=UPI0025D4A7E1|nr:hypothetical protein [Phaeodactylibacter sp.]MCI4650628.1 hypothetical protein [Phaeodactylibacter sp.]MCI5091266.1 hypothetical protein [Phaeodactylibacter sp.]
MAHQKEPSNKSPEQETPAWLLRVQEQSWEPEILVSGIVLYGLFQAPALLERLQHFLSHFSFEVFSAGTADESMVAVLKVANVWLIGGFMVHLLLRSIWVALVGLSYVYKNGVDISRLKMGESYNRLIFKDAQYTRNIVRLEEICSTTFAVSFLLFMLLLGGCFFLGVVVALLAAWLYFFPNRAEQLTTIDPILSIIGGIYVLDFLTLGLLKRIPYFSKFYLPIYRVMSWLTLSPLYRKIYYGLVSNHAKWKSVLAILIFLSVTALLYSGFRLKNNPADALALRLLDTAEQLMYPGHYANWAGNKPSGLLQIPSDVIEANVLSVFVVHRSAYEERYIKPLCNYSSRQDSVDQDILVMDCLSRFYTLQLDGMPVETDYLFTRKQEPLQVGLQAYLDITHLEKGLHNLELYFQFQQEDGSVRPQQVAKVEFYKTQHAERIPIFTPEIEE